MQSSKSLLALGSYFGMFDLIQSTSPGLFFGVPHFFFLFTFLRKGQFGLTFLRHVLIFSASAPQKRLSTLYMRASSVRLHLLWLSLLPLSLTIKAEAERNNVMIKEITEYCMLDCRWYLGCELLGGFYTHSRLEAE